SRRRARRGPRAGRMGSLRDAPRFTAGHAASIGFGRREEDNAAMKTPSGGRRARLVIRQAQLADLPALVDLTARVYGAEWGHSAEMLRGQITRFAAGQFVAEYEGRIVGYCATFRIDEATAFAP